MEVSEKPKRTRAPRIRIPKAPKPKSTRRPGRPRKIVKAEDIALTFEPMKAIAAIERAATTLSTVGISFDGPDVLLTGLPEDIAKVVKALRNNA